MLSEAYPADLAAFIRTGQERAPAFRDHGHAYAYLFSAVGPGVVSFDMSFHVRSPFHEL